MTNGREVGQLHSTCKLAEQSRGTGNGGEGGKGAGQGELAELSEVMVCVKVS